MSFPGERRAGILVAPGSSPANLLPDGVHTTKGTLVVTVRLPIVTERFLIRPMQPQDTADLFEVYRDAEGLRHLHREVPTSLESAGAWVRAKMERHERDGLSLWSVVQRRTGVVVGDAGLQYERDDGGDVGLGGRLNRRYWHQGCATEVGAALLAAGFDAGLTRIIAVTRPANQPAMDVCDRLGMAFVQRSDYFGEGKGEWLVYEAFASCWSAPPS